MEDIVLDTNVLKHASDPRQADRHAIQKFLEKLKAAATRLCVDVGFSFNPESSNRSYIGSEYLAHLVPGDVGYELIVYLAGNQRVSFVERKVDQRSRKIIQKNVHDQADRVFVQVAVNAEEKILTTHDFQNFPPKVCQILLDELNIQVLSSKNAGELL